MMSIDPVPLHWVRTDGSTHTKGRKPKFEKSSPKDLICFRQTTPAPILAARLRLAAIYPFRFVSVDLLRA